MQNGAPGRQQGRIPEPFKASPCWPLRSSLPGRHRECHFFCYGPLSMVSRIFANTRRKFPFQILISHARFYTYNFLSDRDWLKKMIPSRLLQRASVGLTASVVSDTIVNVFRVIKTTKQALGSKRDLSYGETIRMVLAADGWKGLFGRGLRTRIFANALQSIVFTVIWRGLAERWGGGSRSDNAGEQTTEEEGTKTQI